MSENFIQGQYDLTKKSPLKKFYDDNKILIYSLITIFFIFLGSLAYYINLKEKKRILISNSFIDAKVLLKNGESEKAQKILRMIVEGKNNTYSALSLFLIINEDLITDNNELNTLFNLILENNKFEPEIKNLIIYKKALHQSSFEQEAILLQTLKPLMNSETLWKPHAFLLIADYFFSKGEFIKSKEFYNRIIALKNVNQELFDHARSQLLSIANE